MSATLRLCSAVLAVAVLTACSGVRGGEDGSGADLGGRQVTVAVENSYLPYSYVNANTGEAEGWDYDMLAELCARLNCEPIFVPIPWEPTLATVGRGDIDMAANGIVINAERDKIVDYADSYASARQYVFVRADEDRIDGPEDLADGDYLVAAQVSTVNSAKAEELVGKENVVTFAHFGDAVAAVANGEADAFLHLLKDGQELMGPHAAAVRIAGEPVVQLDYGFIFAEGSDLVEPFNEALAAMKADGTLAELNDRYFGPSFSITPDDIAPPVYNDSPTPQAAEAS